MKSRHEIALALAEQITLNRVICVNKNYAPGTLCYWVVSTQSLEEELRRILSEEQAFLLSYELFDEIFYELESRLEHRLLSSGITR